MPALETSQFWTPMILCVAISSIFALLVLYYFRQQINTLDHKINSMFSLITSITNELNRITMLQTGGDMNFESNIQPGLQASQIEVSDDEEEYEDDEDEEDNENTDFLNKTVLLTSADLNMEEDDEDEDSNDEDSDDEDSDDEDSDDDSIEDINNDFDTLKIIGEEKSIHLGEEIIDHTQGNDDVKILELEVDGLENLDEELIESIVELEAIDNLPIVADEDSSDNENSNEELIDIHSKSIEIVDYKKLPVKTLRDIVVAKGLVQNASKLAKKQLLELLEGN